jgi:formylglycine-generating enzyme required for sulfatase activity
MNRTVALSFVVISAVTISCKPRRQAGDSSLKEYGVFNASDPCNSARGSSGGRSGGRSAPVSMKFERVPSGNFMMGSNISEKNRGEDEYQHKVELEAFCLQTTEVTQEQWFEVSRNTQFMRDTPSTFRKENHCPGEYRRDKEICPNNPVESVSWEAVLYFLKEMNDMSDGFRYRLPTEAEWEYAARAGTTDQYSWKGNLGDFAWYANNAGGKTHAVAKQKPNAYGLYDVHGNVSEWTSDYIGDYRDLRIRNPVADVYKSGRGNRVFRGCSFDSPEEACRSALRRSGGVGGRSNSIGFRLVRIPNR